MVLSAELPKTWEVLRRDISLRTESLARYLRCFGHCPLEAQPVQAARLRLTRLEVAPLALCPKYLLEVAQAVRIALVAIAPLKRHQAEAYRELSALLEGGLQSGVGDLSHAERLACLLSKVCDGPPTGRRLI